MARKTKMNENKNKSNKNHVSHSSDEYDINNPDISIIDSLADDLRTKKSDDKVVRSETILRNMVEWDLETKTLDGLPIQITDGDQTSFRSKVFPPRKREALRTLSSLYGPICLRWSSDSNECDKFLMACTRGDLGSVKKFLGDFDKSKSRGWNYSERRLKFESRITPLRLSAFLIVCVFQNLISIMIDQRKDIQFNHFHPDYLGVAITLLKYGARPDAKDICGNNVLHFLSNKGSNEKSLQLMRECILAAKSSKHVGEEIILMNLSSKTYNGRRGILGGYKTSDKTSEYGRRIVILDDKEIALQPKNLFVQDAEGNMKCILEDAYDLVNDENRLGNTCAHTIAENSEMSSMRLIMKYGAKVDIENCDGHTPLKKCLLVVKGETPMTFMLKTYAKKMEDEKIVTCQYCGKVKDISYLCGKCHLACYCTEKCQINHWPTHKLYCKDEQGIVLEDAERIKEYFDGYEAGQLCKVTFTYDAEQCRLFSEERPDIFDIKLDKGTSAFDTLKMKAVEKGCKVLQLIQLNVSFDGYGKCTVYPESFDFPTLRYSV